MKKPVFPEVDDGKPEFMSRRTSLKRVPSEVKSDLDAYIYTINSWDLGQTPN